MKDPVAAIRGQGAARIVVAVPVAPHEALAEIAARADDVVCLIPSRTVREVGRCLADFHQITDQQTIGLLRQAWTAGDPSMESRPRTVRIPPQGLDGDLTLPADPPGIVLFAHGSGSSRLSPRNRAVAESLNAHGFAALLMDLLIPAKPMTGATCSTFQCSLNASRRQRCGLRPSPMSPICRWVCSGPAPERRRRFWRGPKCTTGLPQLCRVAGGGILPDRVCRMCARRRC